jgi:hypothetical protein
MGSIPSTAVENENENKKVLFQDRYGIKLGAASGH